MVFHKVAYEACEKVLRVFLLRIGFDFLIRVRSIVDSDSIERGDHRGILYKIEFIPGVERGYCLDIFIYQPAFSAGTITLNFPNQKGKFEFEFFGGEVRIK